MAPHLFERSDMVRHRRMRSAVVGMISRQVGVEEIASHVRLSVNGTSLVDSSGTPVFLRGVNQGTWGVDYEVDAADILALGANCVRTVFRWWGPYSVAGTDSRSLNLADDYIDPANLATFLTQVGWLVAQGLWVIVAFDSNCGQDGLQDGTTELFCDPAGAYPSNGRNFFTDTATREFFKVAWKRLARELKMIDKIALLELLPEPLNGRDDTWADDVRDFYRDVISAVRSEDSRTPFLVGPRDAYNINLVEESFLAERSDVVYTGNLLSPRVINQTDLPANLATLTTFRDTHNVPVFVQQLGRTSDLDPTLTAMNGAMSLLNSQRVPYAWWQYHQNTTSPDEYALYYKDGLGGWTPKPAEIASFSYHVTQSIGTLEEDALATATSTGSTLFYIKADLSNVFQDSSGTTPVTGVGQPIGRINAVVGTGFLSQGTAGARPLLALGANGYSWSLDGVDDYLALDTTYFSAGDDTMVLAAGVPNETSTQRVMFQCGTSGSTVQYPALGLNASDLPVASWQGADAVPHECTGSTPCSLRPVILTAYKTGNNKTLYVNGIQEGSTSTGTVGTFTPTRARVGSSSGSSRYFSGQMSMVCLSKTMTSLEAQVVERYGGFRVGAAYKAPIPVSNSGVWDDSLTWNDATTWTD